MDAREALNSLQGYAARDGLNKEAEVWAAIVTTALDEWDRLREDVASLDHTLSVTAASLNDKLERLRRAGRENYRLAARVAELENEVARLRILRSERA